MKKVLHIVQLQEHPGGIENVVLNLTKAIDKNAFHFDYLTTSEKSCYEQELERLGGKIYYFPSVIKHPFRYYFMLRRILITNRYDIVHIHKNSLSNCLPILFCKGLKCQIVLHSHNTSAAGKGTIVKLKNMIHYFNRFFINHMNIKKVACSELAAKWMFGPKDTESTILHNGINIDTFKFDTAYRAQIRSKYGISENDFLIGHIGRYRKQKNHVFMIELLQKLLKNRNIYLLLIGSGELYDNIKKKVEDFGIQKNVITVKETKETYKYYSAFDLFILPSLYEGLPLVGVEAQINGVPCLFSDAISREVKINDNADMCPLENPDEWIKQIKKYMKRDGRIASSHLRILNTKYDINFEIKKLEKLYLSTQ